MRSSSKEKRLFKQEVRTTQERLEGNFRTDNGGEGDIKISNGTNYYILSVQFHGTVKFPIFNNKNKKKSETRIESIRKRGIRKLNHRVISRGCATQTCYYLYVKFGIWRRFIKLSPYEGEEQTSPDCFSLFVYPPPPPFCEFPLTGELYRRLCKRDIYHALLTSCRSNNNNNR